MGVDITTTLLGNTGATAPTLGDYVSLFLRVAFVSAGLIMLLMAIFGGLSMISGAGNDNPKSVSQGKQAISSAIIGILIIFVAYWIIRIIELMTKSNFITNP